MYITSSTSRISFGIRQGRPWAAAATLLACFACSVTLAATSHAAERNVLFIITDDESPTLGCYGDPCAVTPAIDAVAADGLIFRNAFATTASCSASRSVIMSGLQNHRNGQFGHQHHYHKFSSFDDVIGLALPRVMQRAGYRTGQIGKYHVAPEEVYHFETYLTGNSRNAVAMADTAKEFITDTTDERPFFLYFATSDPHRGGGVDKTSDLKLKPNLFGNKAKHGEFPGVKEVFFDPADVIVPPFLPDTPETRSELAQYYQSCSRIDQGVARLVQILKDAGLYEKTLIVFTSDHGMAFAGGKTTVYEGGLRVPMVVRNPYVAERGVESDALVSHVDVTPTLLDFAGGLNRKKNAPKDMLNARKYWLEKGLSPIDNRDGGQPLDHYHGTSWLDVLSNPERSHHNEIFASHTFHEIQMYYPMRVIRDEKYKLIWNIAHPLPYPFASDLWAASSWQAQLAKGLEAPYGNTTVGHYIQRPEFELFDIVADPYEQHNLAESSGNQELLKKYQAKLKAAQKQFDDPWIMKWDYE
ncbi:sulfatase family protein [Allorhodopirellula heiligendammensis]|uniref:Arylsulfatase n=1 Tax=Allorhodopirellula heiligendammensis TaxID=2714739 RepID=A0A5C6C519_9BACT|nr:sulfatase [Allorhodopirellula heiligendammensis]TWU18424.1 Arylsulfatase [Allorhodopirellula heiligendammensis]